MRDETANNQTIEHPELIDMRTHLTVAMLAASQLTRRTQHLPEAAHLQDYLDQSLKSLVEDVGKVDELIMQTEESKAVAPPKAIGHRVPRFLRWGISLPRRAARGVCGWLHRKKYARLTALSLYR